MRSRLHLQAALLWAVTGVLPAQAAPDHVALGDGEYAAFHAEAALRHYEAAIAADGRNADALGKASRSAVDFAEGTTDAARQAELFRLGEQYARRATEVNPNDAELQFYVARALGRLALSVGVRARVRFAVEIRERALAALKLNPDHAGALHVMGMWNAEVMRLNGVERFFAKNVLGGRTFGLANWKDAVSSLERAVQVDPTRLTHRLDLALIYRDVGEKAKAVEQLGLVLAVTMQSDVNDPLYKRQAEGALQKLQR